MRVLLTAILVSGVAGLGCIVGGVYVLAGFGWALVAGGVGLCAAAVLIGVAARNG